MVPPKATERKLGWIEIFLRVKTKSADGEIWGQSGIDAQNYLKPFSFSRGKKNGIRSEKVILDMLLG